MQSVWLCDSTSFQLCVQLNCKGSALFLPTLISAFQADDKLTGTIALALQRIGWVSFCKSFLRSPKGTLVTLFSHQDRGTSKYLNSDYAQVVSAAAAERQTRRNVCFGDHFCVSGN